MTDSPVSRPAGAFPIRPLTSEVAGNVPATTGINQNETFQNLANGVTGSKNSAGILAPTTELWDAGFAAWYAAEVTAGRKVFTSYKGQSYRTVTPAEKTALGGMGAPDYSHFPGAGVTAGDDDTFNWIATPDKHFKYLKDPANEVNPRLLLASLSAEIGQRFYTDSYYQGSSLGGGTYQWVASGTGNEDGGAYIDIGSLQAELLTPESLNASKYGLSTLATGTQNRDQLQLAIDSGTPVQVHSGTHEIHGDLIISKNDTVFEGNGFGSTVMDFVNSGIIVDSNIETSDNLRRWQLKGMRLNRRGGVGSVLTLDGFSEGTDTTQWQASSRWIVKDIHIDRAFGCLGIDASDMYSGIMHGVFVLGCDVGWRFYRKNNGAVSGNAVSVVGGEAQGCRIGVEADNTAGLAFAGGFATQGNREAGIDLLGNNRGLSVNGCYFEYNGVGVGGVLADKNCDVRVGSASPWPAEAGVSFIGNTHFGQTKHAFYLNRGQVNISSAVFLGYTGIPIKNAGGSAVSGTVSASCYKNGSINAPMVDGITENFRHEASTPIIELTSSQTLEASYQRTIITNTGATSGAIHTLPPAVAGREMQFICTTANTFRITPRSTDRYSDGALGAYLNTNVVNSSLKIMCVEDGVWQYETIGTWTGP